LLEGLRALTDAQTLPAISVLAFISWAGRAGVVWCMLRAFHLDLPPLAALGTLIAINIGISVVAVPANAGVYETSAAAALALWGVPTATGVSCGAAMHVAEIAPVVLLGALVMVTTGVRLREPRVSGA
jgi:uncharacterized membrane protein YbhN (UPF0104 family)